MLIVVDIGNTQTVIGLYERESANLVASWRIATNKSDAEGDIISKLYALFEAVQLKLDSVRYATIASVVPALSEVWMRVTSELWDIDALMCNAEIATRLGLFEADYPNAKEIGADRVADAIAARSIFGSPVVVVDFGTATNIEVIDERGMFVGGAIAPGIITGANALFAHASRLAGTSYLTCENAIGKSTEEALQSGIIYGEVGRVDGIVTKMLAELGIADLVDSQVHVVATGGLASTISARSATITDVRPELTLDGLRILSGEFIRRR